MRTILNETDPVEGDSAVMVHVTRVDASPISLSEETCTRYASVPRDEWVATLRRWGVPYRRSGKLHVALTADVEAAIREGAERKPGPKPRPKKAEGEPASAASLLSRAGYRKVAP